MGAKEMIKKAESMHSSGRMPEDVFNKVCQAAWKLAPELAPAKEERPQLLTLAETGDVDAMRELLVCGTDPNTIDKHGTTPLLLATRNGHSDCAQTLIQHRADVNQVGSWNFSPLMYAAI